MFYLHLMLYFYIYTICRKFLFSLLTNFYRTFRWNIKNRYFRKEWIDIYIFFYYFQRVICANCFFSTIFMEFVWCFVYCTYVVVISDHVRWNVCRSSFHRFLVSTSRNMIVHFSLCSRYLRIFWKLKNIIFLPCSCLFCAWLHKKRHIDFYWIFRLFVSPRYSIEISKQDNFERRKSFCKIVMKIIR